MTDPPSAQPPAGTSARTVAMAIRSGAVAAGATLAFNLLVLPFVIYRLGANLYGAWIALSALVAVGALADAGISTEVARRVAAASGAGDRAALGRVVHVGTSAMILVVLPVTVLVLVAAPQLANVVLPDGVTGYKSGDVALVIRVLAVITGVGLVLSAHFAALRGIQRSDVQALAQVASLAPYAAVLLLGIHAGWGLWALAAAQGAMALASWALQWVAMRRLVPGLRLRAPLAPVPVLISYLSLSVLALLSQLGDVVDSQWDKLVISHFIDSSAVTSFHVATMLVLQAKVLALLPLAPLLAGISELRVSRADEARALQQRLMKAASATGAVILGGVLVFAPAFLRLWLGPGFEEAGTMARIFVVAVAFNVLSAPLAIQAFGEGRHRDAAGSAFANMAVNAVASLVLTVQIGVLGAVIGSVVGNVVGAGVLVILSRRRGTWIGLPWAAPLVAITLVAATIAAGLDSQASWPSLLAASGAFAVVCALGVARVERITVADAATLLRRRSG